MTHSEQAGIEPEDNDEAAAATERAPGRVLLFVVAAAACAMLGYCVWREGPRRAPYAAFQREYLAAVRAHGVGAAADGSGQRPRIHTLEAAGKVDRCPTCHLATTEPTPARRAGSDRLSKHPLRPHPQALLSHHPLGKLLCRDCHGTGGAYVDRCLPALGDVDGRALGGRHAQASCRLCHRDADELPLAEALNIGHIAYRRLGCGGCHRDDLPNSRLPRRFIGPRLASVVTKRSLRDVQAFLRDPQRVRPGSAMPSYFGPDAVRGAPAFTRRIKHEETELVIDQLLAYLRALAPEPGAARIATGSVAATAPDPSAGSAARERAQAFGCVACHEFAQPSSQEAAARGRRSPSVLGGVGPNLFDAPRRLGAAFVRTWLAGPARYDRDTAMPDLRLTERDIRQLEPLLAAREHATVDESPGPSKERVAEGLAVVRSLGCAGCHRLPGLADEPEVGPDLIGYGDKRLGLLDFGHRSVDGTPRTVFRWTELKLSAPLTFDRAPGVLKMPWQQMDDDERQGLGLLLRSFTKPEHRGAWLAQPAADTQALRAGARLVRTFGCAKCHELGQQPSALSSLYKEPAGRPPTLLGEGNKVQPAWLYDYLAAPTPLRPWLSLRMPTFNLGPAERKTLAAYFAARDRASYPFVDEAAPTALGSPVALREARALFDRLQCIRCHLLTNAEKLRPGELAPDLSLAARRLRRAWVRRFMLEPQALIPGTKMPSLFPLADEDDPKSRITSEPGFFGGDVARQIDALTDLTMQWGR